MFSKKNKGYLARMIKDEIYISSDPITFNNKIYDPSKKEEGDGFKWFKNKNEVYKHFGIMNPDLTLYKFKTNGNDEIYVIAEEEDIARDKANKYLKERYFAGNLVNISGFADEIAETETKGNAPKLIM